MKKIINKNTVFSFILGLLLCSGMVYGVNSYQSNTIEYNPSDSNWEVSNVSDAINSLHSMVKELETIKSIGDATATQILAGKKAVVKGNIITGTMTNKGAVTSTLNAGGSYTIPAGYHNGSGKVTANSLASQTSATATASDIANGKTAWVNGTKITGTSIITNKIYLPDLYFHDAGGSQADGYLIYDSEKYSNLHIDYLGLTNEYNGYDWVRFYIYGINDTTETEIYYRNSTVIGLTSHKNININISKYKKIKISYMVFCSSINVNGIYLS